MRAYNLLPWRKRYQQQKVRKFYWYSLCILFIFCAFAGRVFLTKQQQLRQLNLQWHQKSQIKQARELSAVDHYQALNKKILLSLSMLATAGESEIKLTQLMWDNGQLKVVGFARELPAMESFFQAIKRQVVYASVKLQNIQQFDGFLQFQLVLN